MRKNALKQAWSEGKTTINGWLHIPSGWSAELMAHAGWDSITIDMQHGMMGFESAFAILQAISTTDVVPMVRIPWNEPAITQRLLDAGAYGIICPVINTREDCERFIGACRYPPLGYRSYGPTRANVYAGKDYAPNANETIAAFAMVETAEGVSNLDKILDVPGLDGVFVGPADLALTMVGQYGVGISHLAVAEAVRTIAEKTRAAGKVPGIWCATAEVALEMQALGYQFLTISSDTRLLTAGAQAEIVKFRKGVD